MTSEIIDNARQQLEAAIEQKLDTLSAYQQRVDEVQRLEHELNQARRSQDEGWRALQAADWTDSELQTLGVTAPAGASKPARRTPRKKSTSQNGQA